jgi:hypothetical protein
MTSGTEPPDVNEPLPPSVATELKLPDVTVVIPALNEQDNLSLLLPLVGDAISELNAT